MTTKRVKRPKLEREQPNRSWSTMFGSVPGKGPVPNGQDSGNGVGGAQRSDGAALTDAVQVGYRVIEDYLKQSQQVAQAFAPGSWTGAPTPGSADDMQQMAQRVMQYGWDFAGLWMEMWSRMGKGSPFGPPMPGMNMDFRPPPAPESAGPAPSSPAAPLVSEVVAVSVESLLPTTTSVELRPGQSSELVIHALRPEGHEAMPIRDVSLERAQEDGRLHVLVVVPAEQAPGEYRAVIAEASSNMPRGALSVRVHPKRR